MNSLSLCIKFANIFFSNTELSPPAHIHKSQRKTPFTIATKVPGNKFKEVKDLYIKHCKTETKESKDDTNKQKYQRAVFAFVDWQN